MFTLSKSDQYSWPVKVESPKSGGTWDKMSFDVIFKRLKQSQIKDLIDAEGADDLKFCRAVVVGWKGIQTEDRQDVPFSSDSLEQLIDEPRTAVAIVKAYLESVAGAPTKN